MRPPAKQSDIEQALNKHFQKQRNSKNWGLPSMRLQNQAFG